MNTLTSCFLSQYTNRQVRTDANQRKTNEAINRHVVHKGGGIGQHKPGQLQADVAENAAAHAITEPLLHHARHQNEVKQSHNLQTQTHTPQPT